mmetsp:Transcript_69149/g.195181  ORF Transcript_69149/g.195181 Transcript_69149/m.195181 type:complete len:519 (-) Transcript_69149:122-1678(-)
MPSSPSLSSPSGPPSGKAGGPPNSPSSKTDEAGASTASSSSAEDIAPGKASSEAARGTEAGSSGKAISVTDDSWAESGAPRNANSSADMYRVASGASGKALWATGASGNAVSPSSWGATSADSATSWHAMSASPQADGDRRANSGVSEKAARVGGYAMADSGASGNAVSSSGSRSGVAASGNAVSACSDSTADSGASGKAVSAGNDSRAGAGASGKATSKGSECTAVSGASGNTIVSANSSSMLSMATGYENNGYSMSSKEDSERSEDKRSRSSSEAAPSSVVKFKPSTSSSDTISTALLASRADCVTETSSASSKFSPAMTSSIPASGKAPSDDVTRRNERRLVATAWVDATAVGGEAVHSPRLADSITSGSTAASGKVCSSSSSSSSICSTCCTCCSPLSTLRLSHFANPRIIDLGNQGALSPSLLRRPSILDHARAPAVAAAACSRRPWSGRRGGRRRGRRRGGIGGRRPRPPRLGEVPLPKLPERVLLLQLPEPLRGARPRAQRRQSRGRGRRR